MKGQKFNVGTSRHGYSKMHNFIYIDEYGINLWTKRTRGRARRGDHAVRVVQGRRGPNLTMTFAVNVTSGLVHHQLHQGGMTALQSVHGRRIYI